MSNGKQVILFIVEGASDLIALKLPIKKLFSNQNLLSNIQIEIYGTDPLIHWPKQTDRKLWEADSLCDRIGASVKNFIKSPKCKISPSDIAAVAVIGDLDACFCPAESVFKNTDGDFIVYDADGQRIFCENVPFLIKRNEIKKDSVDMFRCYKDIRPYLCKKTVPLAFFYNNMNLEHAISGVYGPLTEEEKIRNAKAFRQKYSDDPVGFLALLNELRAGADNYDESLRKAYLAKEPFCRRSNLYFVIEWAKSIFPR